MATFDEVRQQWVEKGRAAARLHKAVASIPETVRTDKQRVAWQAAYLAYYRRDDHPTPENKAWLEGWHEVYANMLFVTVET
jgi:hypothetical protein